MQISQPSFLFTTTFLPYKAKARTSPPIIINPPETALAAAAFPVTWAGAEEEAEIDGAEVLVALVVRVKFELLVGAAEAEAEVDVSVVELVLV